MVEDFANGNQVIGRADGFADDIQVNRAEHGVVGLVARPDVLDEPSVGIRPAIILLPTEAGIAPRDFNERDEPLFIQIINLAIDKAKVIGINAIDVGKHVFVAGNFARN